MVVVEAGKQSERDGHMAWDKDSDRDGNWNKGESWNLGLVYNLHDEVVQEVVAWNFHETLGKQLPAHTSFWRKKWEGQEHVRVRCQHETTGRLPATEQEEEDRQARRHKKGPRRGRGPVYSVKFNEPNQLYATRSLAKKVLFQVSWPHSFFHFNGNAKNNKNKQQE